MAADAEKIQKRRDSGRDRIFDDGTVGKKCHDGWSRRGESKDRCRRASSITIEVIRYGKFVVYGGGINTCCCVEEQMLNRLLPKLERDTIPNAQR